MMGHRRFKKRLSAYLDGELTEGACQEMEAHLERCPTCQWELVEMRYIDEMVHGMERLTPSPYFLTRLKARLAEGKEPRYGFLPLTWCKRLVAPVAVGVVLFVSVIAGGYMGMIRYQGASTEVADEQVFTDFSAPSAGEVYFDLVEEVASAQK